MADNSDLIPLIERLQSARVLCIGDVMLDHYVYGQVERVSPEAPIPVLRIERELKTLGGAGNVLRNLAALGAQASFVSVVGNDDAGREISRLLEAQDGAEVHVLVQPHADDDGQDPLCRRQPAAAARRSRDGGPARPLYPRRPAAAGARAGDATSRWSSSPITPRGC